MWRKLARPVTRPAPAPASIHHPAAAVGWDLREAPQTAPDAAAPAALQPDIAVGLWAMRRWSGFHRQGPCAACCRESFAAREASAGSPCQRAALAGGCGAGAQGGAQVHHGLAVGRAALPGVPSRRPVPQLAFGRRAPGQPATPPVAGQHPLDVAVENQPPACRRQC